MMSRNLSELTAERLTARFGRRPGQRRFRARLQDVLAKREAALEADQKARVAIEKRAAAVVEWLRGLLRRRDGAAERKPRRASRGSEG